MEELEAGDRVITGRSSPLGQLMGVVVKIERDTAWGDLFHVQPQGYQEAEPFTRDELQKVTIVED